MGHSFNKHKNDFFIALIVGPAQVAGITIWVVHLQAAIKGHPWLAAFVVIAAVFPELFGPWFWLSALVSE